GAAEARQPDRRRALHRRIAEAGIRAALAGDDEAELGTGLIDRNQERDGIARGLDVLLERLVELHLAGRNGSRPERGASGRELELLAIEVIARSDREGHLDRLGIVRLRRELERLLGLEEFVVRGARRRRGDRREQRDRD